MQPHGTDVRVSDAEGRARICERLSPSKALNSLREILVSVIEEGTPAGADPLILGYCETL